MGTFTWPRQGAWRGIGESDVARLHATTRTVLAKMVARGGRDTETDLFGRPGEYRTVMWARRLAEPCPACGSAKVKEAYLGGSAYDCPRCQSRSPPDA